MAQEYFIDATLLNHRLIVLNKVERIPQIDALKQNSDIEVRIYEGEKIVCKSEKCHIDNTFKRRLRVSDEIMVWIRSEFPFSVAYFEGHADETKIGIWKNADIEIFNAALKKAKDKKTGETIKMTVPGETISLSWENELSGGYLKICHGFKITCENAAQYLSPNALASVLPYIFSSVKNTSIADTRINEKKCYFIDRTTDWLSVKDYVTTSFSHPGLYMLRRKTDNNTYAYYIGKAVDIKRRIIKSDNKVSHPDEKYEEKKQYDDIACISIKFDELLNLYGVLDESNRTHVNNPGVARGSQTDNALYAVEDIAIHVAAMLLKSEGVVLDNKQFRSYTKQWL